MRRIIGCAYSLPFETVCLEAKVCFGFHEQLSPPHHLPSEILLTGRALGSTGQKRDQRGKYCVTIPTYSAV